MRGKFKTNSVVSQHWEAVFEKKQTKFCEMRIAPNSVVSVFEQVGGGVLNFFACGSKSDPATPGGTPGAPQAPEAPSPGVRRALLRCRVCPHQGQTCIVALASLSRSGSDVRGHIFQNGFRFIEQRQESVVRALLPNFQYRPRHRRPVASDDRRKLSQTSDLV
jgi:hypothetical protein